MKVKMSWNNVYATFYNYDIHKYESVKNV